jgi:hypothetical protein
MQIECGDKEMIQQTGEYFLNDDIETVKAMVKSYVVLWGPAQEGEWWVAGLVLVVVKDRVYFHHVDG